MRPSRLFQVIVVLVSVFVFASPAFAIKDASDPAAQDEIKEQIKTQEECPQDFARGCGCREKTKESETSFGTCVDEKQVCKDGTILYSCCVCSQIIGDRFGQQTIQEMKAEGGHTYTSCEEVCAAGTPPGTVYRQVGAGTLPAPKSAAAPTAAQVQERSMLCFTPTDCASPEYGGSPEAFVSGQGCPSGQGKCVAPEPEIELSYPIGNITTVRGFRNFVAVAFNYLVSIAAIAAAVMFVYGGFRYIFGSAFKSIGEAKHIMIDAAIGLVLTLGSITILQTINKDTLDLTRLNVFLINKQQIMTNKFCQDIKSEKPLLFADAGGPRPAFTPVNQITNYSVAQEDTLCNYDYYAKDYGDNRCVGRKCTEKGEACVSCRAKGACKDGASPNSYECVQAGFSGNITYTDGRYVDALVPLIICNNAASKWDPSNATPSIEGGIFEMTQVQNFQVKGESKSTGAQFFKFDLSPESVSQMETKCANYGGPLGLVLGVEYEDSNFGPTNDDYLVIGKKDCGVPAQFSGYIDGSTASFTMTDLRRAVYCSIPKLTSGKNVWTLDELQKAVGSADVPATGNIQCDFQLNAMNAHSDPQKTLGIACRL